MKKTIKDYRESKEELKNAKSELKKSLKNLHNALKEGIVPIGILIITIFIIVKSLK